MTDFDRDMQALAAQLDEDIAAAVSRARSTTMEEGLALDPRTIENIKALGLVPTGEEERLALLQTGAPRVNGALPVELRHLLLVLQKQYETRFYQLINQYRDTSEVDRIDWSVDFKRKLSDFVTETVRDYIKQVRVSTLNSIFANARATAPRYEQAATHTHTETCDCCGAPRPDSTDLRYCAYCGNQLFAAV